MSFIVSIPLKVMSPAESAAMYQEKVDAMTAALKEAAPVEEQPVAAAGGAAAAQREQERWDVVAEAANAGDAEAMFKMGQHTKNPSWYTKAAKAGHVKAMVALARSWEEKGQLQEAAKWWDKAAAKKDVEALLMQGENFFRGKGVKKDISTAEASFSTAAEKGCVAAMVRLAEVARNKDLSLYWREEAAKGGDLESILYMAKQGNKEQAQAMYKLAADFGHVGSLYEKAKAYDAAGNASKALVFYRHAAAGGHGESMFEIALAHGQGTHGLYQDKEQAKLWCMKAAKAGVEEARRSLQSILEQETLVRDNMRKIQEFHEPAQEVIRRELTAKAKQGDVQAMLALGNEYRKVGFDPGAYPWFRHAADVGNLEAIHRMGIYASYDQSRTFHEAAGLDPKDFPSSREWFERGAKQEDGPCLCELGMCCLEDPKEDVSVGLKYLERSVKAGHGEAAMQLATAYFVKGRVAPDAKLSLDWLTRAWEMGHSSAAFAFGAIFQRGDLGQAIDYEKAAHWYKIAVDRNVPDAREPYDQVMAILAKQQKQRLQQEAEHKRSVEKASGASDFAQALRLEDAAKAARLLRVAAAKGHEEAGKMVPPPGGPILRN